MTASVTTINRQAEGENWRAAVGDLLAEENVRGVIVAVFYEDEYHSYMIRHINVRSSDLALMGAKLARIATDDS